MSKQHLRLILNGKSVARPDVRAAVNAVRNAGHEVSVRVTFEAGDVARLCEEALQDHRTKKIDTLVSGGGDGTLQEVMDAVLTTLPDREKPPFSFAVLPLGTANDFARQIGLDPSDLTSCLRFASRARAKPMDVGDVNGSKFVNMATGGFGTQVTAETDPQLKKVLGSAAYLFTGLNRFSELAACEGQIDAEDFSWEGAFLALAIGNGQRAGGGIRLCPEAVLDDGLLDLTIVPMPEKGRGMQLIKTLLEDGVDGMRSAIVFRKVRAVRIRTENEVQFNLDGEPRTDRDWHISVDQNRIEMRR